MNMLLAALLGVVLVGGVTLLISPTPQPAPKLQDTYWGPGEEPAKLDESVRPFKLEFKKEMIDDLRHRLKNARLSQPALEDVGWTYGITSDYMPKVIEHWLNKYDFKKREAQLNSFPQFLTNVQGLDIHFIHAKPQLPKDRKIAVLPLYLQHGWPGSVVEFHKIIPLLTTPRPDRDYVFEVIAPSLPGFGYSSPAAKAGLGAVELAHLMKNLMLRLGFDKWYTQGGDWGAVISSHMAAIYPEHILGLHSNFCCVLRPWTLLKMGLYNMVPSLLPEDERDRLFPLSKQLMKLIEESGYFHEQATKPDTIGIGISDSPTGLAAYILEKFATATNYENKFHDDGNLLEKFTMDELIDNIMLYWVPNKAASSLRIYAESFNKHSLKYKIENVPVTPPTACLQLIHEIIYQPEIFLRDRFVNLMRVTKVQHGGHFAAMEEPQIFADDVWDSVQLFREHHADQEKLRLERQQA